MKNRIGDSQLTIEFLDRYKPLEIERTRFALGGKRMRRIGIVALARRLLIALWRYVQRGVIPESASLKPL